MRGIDLIVGFLLGNKTTRDWLIKQLDQASRVVEKEFKKSELGKIFSQTQTAEVKQNKDAENKPKKLMIGESYAQENQKTD